MRRRLKIAVMGSGAVGGYFGARLVTGGADVTFVARGAHLAALRQRGLVLVNGADEIHLDDIAAVEDPAAIGFVDLVLFAVKLWDSEAALERIRPIVGPDTVVLSLQNGVLKDEGLIRAFGRNRVMGGVCYLATSLARPGVIVRTGEMERLVFGEFDGTASPRARGASSRPSGAPASTPSSAKTFAATSGRSSCSWQPYRERPRPCARPSERSAAIRERALLCGT